MLMPEATVNEECDAAAGKDEVGRARQIMSMETKPQACRVCGPSHYQLRLRIDLTNTAHVSATLGGRQVVAQSFLDKPVVSERVIGFLATKIRFFHGC
jgi:hypothetical protein